MIKVGITGIGGYARLLLEQLLELQAKKELELRLAVVQDPKMDAHSLDYLRSKSSSTLIYPDLSSATVEDLDLMLLPVGISAHKKLTLEALDAGWNVLVEKPLAGDCTDAEAIVKAADKSEQFVAVGYQYMYGPMTLMIKDLILAGEIGAISRIKASCVWARPKSYYQRNDWAGRLYDNGHAVFDSPINNAMAHFLNLALFFGGKQRHGVAHPVNVQGKMLRAHAIESFDTACLRWQTEFGPDIQVFFSHTGVDETAPTIVVEGDRGRIYWEANSHWQLEKNGKVVTRFEFPATSQMITQVIKRIHDPSVHIYEPHQAIAQVRAVALAHDTLNIEAFPPEKISYVPVRGVDGELDRFVTVEGLKDFCIDVNNE